MCKRVFDEKIELKDNAMLKARPGLFYEWDFSKNDELGLDVYKATKGTHKIVWWLCPKCESPYDMEVSSRTRGSNCPYCKGLRVNNTNSLAALRPEISIQWHPTKNGYLTPKDVPCGTNKEVWWKCPKHKEHSYKDKIANRTRLHTNCPYCSNNRILIGFNDMWTTNPILASMLLNIEDGYKYTQGSKVRVDWRCSGCNISIKNKKIHVIKKHGIRCFQCSDGKSYGEKFIYNILRETNTEFKWEKSFEWSNGKRYDFYLPELNALIEVHGEQHYKKGFETMGGRSLQEEKANDILKREQAIKSGYIYFEINAMDENNIKNEVISSQLHRIINMTNINWGKVHKLSSRSLTIETLNLWNCGNSVSDIIEKLQLSRTTIIKYLKKSTHAGICNYDPKLELIKTVTENGKRNNKPLAQLSMSGKLIKVWASAKEANLVLNIGKPCISAVCKGNQKSAGGFKWMYKEDYDKLIAEQD